MARARWLNRFGGVAFVALMAGVTGCDHATKRLASAELGSRALPIWPHVLELHVAKNTDTAFSLLGGVVPLHARWILLSVASALATLAILAFVVRRWKTLTPTTRIGGALILGGALGNLFDRVASGRVIDFIHVEHWPVFNVADIAVTLGVVLLLWRAGRAEPRTRAGPAV
jgi:signal peptidase II